MAEQPKKELTRADVIASFRSKVEEAMATHMADFDPDKVAQQIIADMNRARQQVVWKILGMDDRWGRWEVDHCNGRESPISRWLAEQVKDEVQAALVELSKDVLGKELRGQIKTQLKDALKKEVRRQIEWNMHDAAKRVVSEVIAEATAEVSKEFKEAP